MINPKRYILSLLILSFIFPLFGQDDDAKRFMEKGKDAYFDKNYDRAVSYFEEVALIDPNFEDLYEYRGNTFYKLGEFREAELDYLEAIKQLPKPDRGSSRRIGDDNFVLLDPGGEEDLNKRYSRIYNNLAVARFKMGRRSAARQAFDMALEYDPDSYIAKENEKSANYNRTSQLQIEDENTKRKRENRDSRSSRTSKEKGYENEFNRRPVSLWKPDDREAYTRMLDLREDREEAVARDENEEEEPQRETVLDRWFGEKVFIKRKVGKRGKTYRRPDFLGASQQYLSIDRVFINSGSTYVTVKVENTNSSSYWISLAPKASSEAFKIVGRGSNRHKSYKLKAIKDVAYYPNTTELKPNGTLYFTLEFERIADNIGFINIVEGKNQRDSAWNFYEVDLRK
ncbi:MAG: tetratricopeptide repeat protein [Bacteroidota bacterium]